MSKFIVRTTLIYEIVIKSNVTGRHKIVELEFNDERKFAIVDHFGFVQFYSKSEQAANARTIELVNDLDIPCLIFDSEGNAWCAQLNGKLDGPHPIAGVYKTDVVIGC